MTQPIRPQTRRPQDPSATAAGPTFKQTKEAQRAERSLTREAANIVKEHLLLEAAKHVAGESVPAAVSAGLYTIECAIRTMEEGKALNDAARREVAKGACLLMCRSELSEKAIENAAQGFVVRGKLPDASAKVLGRLLSTEEGKQQIARTVAQCRAGQLQALRLNLSGDKDLQVALRTNKDFAARYKNDYVFQTGVDAYLWTKQNEPDAHARMLRRLGAN